MRIARAALLLSLLLLTLPAAVQAQYNYTTNFPDTNTITITKYTGPGGAVIIPTNILGLTVTCIGSNAFESCGITNVTIPNSVTDIGDLAFANCTNLTRLCFEGNAPDLGASVFQGDNNTTVYYAFGTTNWGPTFGGRPTALWTQQLTAAVYPLQAGMATGSGTYAVGTNVQLVATPTVATLTNGYTFIGWSNGATNNPYTITMPERNITYTAYFCGFTYTTNSPDTNTITITHFNTAPPLDVTIPGAFNGLTVTCIGSSAFYAWPVTGVTIPNSVTSIGNEAFRDCWALRNVTIPNSVTSMGILAFCDCWGLTNVTIPNSVPSIGWEAFFDCTGLTSVTIASGVTNIVDGAFADCYSLHSVYFKGDAPNLGLSVFQGDNSATVYHTFGTTNWGTTFGGLPTALWMQQLTVTANPTDAGTVTGGGTCAVGTNVQITATASNGWVFANWNDGSTNNPYVITIPETDITYTANFGVDVSQFTYTTNGDATITITGYTGSSGAVTIPYAINGLTVTIIGNLAFYECTNVTSVTVPDGVTSIGEEAFGDCHNLTSVTFGNSINNIGAFAFYYCTNLTSATIPDSVTNIGECAFNCCYYSLTNVTIGSGVATIGRFAFGGCFNLTAITVDAQNSVYSSVAGVLFDKNQTTLIVYPQGKPGDFTIPNSVTTIGRYAVAGCITLTNVTIGNNVTGIVMEAFEFCSSLTNATIGDSVTSIGDYAFYSCTNLTSFMIPASVTSLGIEPFGMCPSLMSVYFRGNAPGIGAPNVFAGDNNATVYHLPGTTNWGSTLGDCPTAVWRPQMPGDASFGLQSNQFGFNISWASGMVVVVEASTNLTGSSWDPLQTNTLSADSSYFSDLNWTNHSVRFYRLRWE